MITYRKVAISYALAFLVGLSAIAPAKAITDGAFNYASKKTGYLALSTMAFAPDGSSTTENPWFNSWQGNYLEGDGCFNAGVNLPNGSEITQLRVMYTKGIYAVLTATERETGITTNITLMSRAINTATRSGYTNTLPGPFVVDNNKYQIGIGICLISGQTFNGARITYTYTTAGD